MKKWILFGIWGCLYIICVALGYAVLEPTPLQTGALLAVALLFFVPPALLVIDAYRQQDAKTLKILRIISICSLALTLLFLVANVFSALGSESLGNTLYEILILVSAPMVCSQRWFLSIFLWACLFFVTLRRTGKAVGK